MKYLLCEIKDDGSLSVLRTQLTEPQAKEACEWSDKYERKSLVLIPHKTVMVESKNYGNDIQATIK